VGAGDFSSHEIAGCEDPRGGTVAVYLTISECDRALNALTLRTTPYDPDYVEGLYSDYTCSDDDDDVYPEAKGKSTIQQAPPHHANLLHPAMAM
jgi:hypothetical protein